MKSARKYWSWKMSASRRCISCAGCRPSATMRLASLNLAAHNECILKLLPRLERLPSIPALYSEIVRLLNNPDVCIEDVGAVIAKDMAITAQILKVVNSSLFGLPRRISEPVEAASYLGVETVKALVLATNVFSQFEVKIGRASCRERVYVLV